MREVQGKEVLHDVRIPLFAGGERRTHVSPGRVPQVGTQGAFDVGRGAPIQEVSAG